MKTPAVLLWLAALTSAHSKSHVEYPVTTEWAIKHLHVPASSIDNNGRPHSTRLVADIPVAIVAYHTRADGKDPEKTRTSTLRDPYVFGPETTVGDMAPGTWTYVDEHGHKETVSVTPHPYKAKRSAPTPTRDLFDAQNHLPIVPEGPPPVMPPPEFLSLRMRSPPTTSQRSTMPTWTNIPTASVPSPTSVLPSYSSVPSRSSAKPSSSGAPTYSTSVWSGSSSWTTRSSSSSTRPTGTSWSSRSSSVPHSHSWSSTHSHHRPTGYGYISSSTSRPRGTGSHSSSKPTSSSSQRHGTGSHSWSKPTSSSSRPHGTGSHSWSKTTPSSSHGTGAHSWSRQTSSTSGPHGTGSHPWSSLEPSKTWGPWGHGTAPSPTWGPWGHRTSDVKSPTPYTSDIWRFTPLTWKPSDLPQSPVAPSSWVTYSRTSTVFVTVTPCATHHPTCTHTWPSLSAFKSCITDTYEITATSSSYCAAEFLTTTYTISAWATDTECWGCATKPWVYATPTEICETYTITPSYIWAWPTESAALQDWASAESTTSTCYGYSIATWGTETSTLSIPVSTTVCPAAITPHPYVVPQIPPPQAVSWEDKTWVQASQTWDVPPPLETPHPWGPISTWTVSWKPYVYDSRTMWYTAVVTAISQPPDEKQTWVAPSAVETSPVQEPPAEPTTVPQPEMPAPPAPEPATPVVPPPAVETAPVQTVVPVTGSAVPLLIDSTLAQLVAVAAAAWICL